MSGLIWVLVTLDRILLKNDFEKISRQQKSIKFFSKWQRVKSGVLWELATLDLDQVEFL